MTPDVTQPGRGRSVEMLITILLVVGAAMLAASGIVHLYLWGKHDGYRAVKIIGPLFLVQGIAGCLLALAVALMRRPILALVGAAYMAGSIGGLYKSIHGGLFDFNETLDAPYVKLALTIEIVGLAAFAVALVLLRRSRVTR